MSCSRPEATRPAALWLALTHGIQGKRLSEAAFESQHSASFWRLLLIWCLNTKSHARD